MFRWASRAERREILQLIFAERPCQGATVFAQDEAIPYMHRYA